MNIEYPRNRYQDATDTGNRKVLQELKPLSIRFFLHQLDYLVFITVETE
jgi:hypothetical protein